ncbi:MAG: hypothetical protein IPK82_27060 [Polyangiaceae bacterium]|nr:hypothetical protein [Polyangiaceae bacterium]
MSARYLVVLAGFGLVLGLTAVACHPPADVVVACDEAAEWCLPCTSDADCGFTGNNCTSTVYCAHRDAPIAVIDIGCSDETTYSWPDDSECTCNGTCVYTP